MEKLTAHQEAKILATKKNTSLEKTIREALNNKVFINPLTKEPYCLTWVIKRLKADDRRVLDKLSNS